MKQENKEGLFSYVFGTFGVLLVLGWLFAYEGIYKRLPLGLRMFLFDFVFVPTAFVVMGPITWITKGYKRLTGQRDVR